MTFDEYWKRHENNYIDLAKERARKDFALLVGADAYFAHVVIESDDDFQLDIAHDFEIQSSSLEKLINDIVMKLNNAKFQSVGSYSIQDKNGKTVTSIRDEEWYNIRNKAIKMLYQGNTYIQYGGNQQITIEIHNKKNQKEC